MRVYRGYTGLGETVDIGYVLTPRAVPRKEDGELLFPGEWKPGTPGRVGECKDNVHFIEALVYDYDHASGPPPQLPYRHHTWTTWSHQDRRGHHSWRVLVPLDRGVSPAEWKILWEHVADLLGWKRQLRKCGDITRLSYLPVRDISTHEGSPLKVDSVLDGVWGKFLLPPTIEPGGRDSTLMRLASALVERTVPPDVVRTALEVVNETRCTPPVGDGEFQRYVDSAVDKFGSRCARDPETVRGALADVGCDRAEITRVLDVCGATMAPPLPNGSEVTLAKVVVGDRLLGICVRDLSVVMWNGNTWATWEDKDISAEALKLDQRAFFKPNGKVGHIDMSAHLASSISKVVWLLADNPIQARTVATPGGNLVRGEIVPPDPSYGARDALEYDPEPGEPTEWLEFLHSLWPKDAQARIECLSTFIGACVLQRITELKRALVFIGRSNSGKSTLCAALSDMLPPERVCSSKPSGWDDMPGRQILVGKWLNIVEELPHSDIMCDDAFKAVISGSPLMSRKLYKDANTVRMCAGHIFAANNLPAVGDPSDGSWDRLVPITFPKKFKQDREAGEMWARRLHDGRGRWLRYCLDRGYAKTLPEPRCADKVKLRWRAFEAVWAWSHAQPKPRVSRSVFDAYSSYKAFCQEHGHSRPTSLARFLERLTGRGWSVKKDVLHPPRGRPVS